MDEIDFEKLHAKIQAKIPPDWVDPKLLEGDKYEEFKKLYIEQSKAPLEIPQSSFYVQLHTEPPEYKFGNYAKTDVTWSTTQGEEYAALALSPLPPIKYPQYKTEMMVVDAEGKSLWIPIQASQFTVEHGYTGESVVVDPNFKIEAIRVTGGDGHTVTQNGPFYVKGSYHKPVETKLVVEKQPPITLKAKSIQREHNGMVFNLAVGDVFTINFKVNDNVPGFPGFDHNETVKILGFNYQTETDVKIEGAGTAKPSPFLLNEGEKNNRKESTHRNNGTFTTTWIEKLECWVIGGHWRNKRYEVILSEPVTKTELFGLFPQDEHLPNSLINAVRICNNSLKQKKSSETGVYKHPKLHSIRVKCPAASPLCVPMGKIHEDSLYLMIQHVNDSHKWTREQIADWIDTLDEQPVFYPVISEPSRVANSAKVVVLEPPVQKGPFD